MCLRLLRSVWRMISSMNSTNAETFSEIRGPHRIGWRFLADSPIYALSFLVSSCSCLSLCHSVLLLPFFVFCCSQMPSSRRNDTLTSCSPTFGELCSPELSNALINLRMHMLINLHLTFIFSVFPISVYSEDHSCSKNIVTHLLV